MSMSEWKEYKLKDIAEIQTGPFGSQLHKSDYVPVGVPCIMPTNIGSHLDLSTDGIARIKEEDAIRLSKHIVHTGDIVYARRGDIEKCAYIKDSQNGWFCGTGCLKVYNFKDNVLPLYIAYQLSTDRCKKLISKNAVGTTMPNLNTTILGDISLFVPQLQTQQNIASILYSLDDKIAVNRRICENLEAQAQALFKHWFIDFAPFKDGKFIETELGMIPEGWRVGRLGDIADINPTRSIKKGEVATYLDMKNMPTSGSFPTAWEKKEFAGGMKFKNGDTLMARITPCLENGKVAFVNFLDDQEIAFGSTEYIVMTAKDMIFPELLYTLCRFPSFVSYATKNMNGSSGRQRVSGETIADYKMVIAPNFVYSEVMPLFHDYMCQIRECGFENRRLSTLRDTLLPKLMSGQIKL